MMHWIWHPCCPSFSLSSFALPVLSMTCSPSRAHLEARFHVARSAPLPSLYLFLRSPLLCVRKVSLTT